MTEPPQVSGFGQDRQSVDRSDSRNPPQQLVVVMISQRDLRHLLDPVALPDQAANASRSSAMMLPGVGKRSISARNQFERLLPAKRAISGKYSGR